MVCTTTLAEAFPGRFDDVKKSGEGTYGVVYICRESRGAEKKAAKVYRDAVEDNGISVDVIRELAVMAHLRHQNIQPIDEFVLRDDTCIMLMPAMTCNVYQFIKNNDFAQEMGASQKLSICKSICSGIAYMHGMNFIHRDIKTANVLLDEHTLSVKVSDFGSARLFLPDQPLTMDITTLFYRAPEMLFGSRDYGLSVDVWSLACTCTEIFKGRELFRPDDDFSEENQISAIFNLIGFSDMAWAMAPGYTRFNPEKMISNVLENSLVAHMKSRCKGCPIEFIDTMNVALQANPLRRLTAQQMCDAIVVPAEETEEDDARLHTQQKKAPPVTVRVPNSEGRTRIVDWIVDIHHALKFNNSTLHLAVDIFDQYCALKHEDMQLAGIVSLFLASKLNETMELEISGMMTWCRNKYEAADFKEMEKRILTSLKGDIIIRNDAAIELTRISDSFLQHIMLYLYESSMLTKPQAALKINRAKSIRKVGCIDKIREAYFKTSVHRSIRKKFGEVLE